MHAGDGVGGVSPEAQAGAPGVGPPQAGNRWRQSQRPRRPGRWKSGEPGRTGSPGAPSRWPEGACPQGQPWALSWGNRVKSRRCSLL